MITAATLLPCPFCGEPAGIRPDEVGSGGQHVRPYHVGCFRCRVMFTEDYEADAIAAWNRRIAPAGIEAAARVLAHWIGISWEGTQDRDISANFPDWSYSGSGDRHMQGGKPALRKVARAMMEACNRG